MSRPIETVLNTLADWICSKDKVEIPADVQGVATTCLVDTIGVGLAGSRTSVAIAAVDLIREVSAEGAAETFIQGTNGFSASAAAFANACASHALDFDDNSYAAFVHGSAVIVPAALAVSQILNRSGDELMTAIIVGSEVQYALGSAATNLLYDRGWWTTGIFGPIGACAATAYLMRLAPQEVASALGIALAGTGGMKACFGTDAKPIMAGRASEAGVIAAFLAARGATGPTDAVEAKTGFASLFTEGAFQVNGIAMPGKNWRLLEPGVDVKRIPVCLASHAAVDAVLDLLSEYGASASEIARIECDVPPIVIANLIYDHPTTRQEAQFSLPYAVAASIHFGRFGLSELEPGALNEPRVQALLNLVEMVSTDFWSDPDLRRTAPEGAFVRIILTDGQELQRFRAFPRGASTEPLSAPEIDSKFLACCAYADLNSGLTLLSRLRNIRSLASTRKLLTITH